MKYDIMHVTNKTLIFAIVLNLIFIFLYVKIFDSYEKVKLSEINMKMIGNKIHVCGYVKDVKHTKRYTSFYLNDGLNSSIYVIFFDEIPVNTQKFTCIKGVIKIYNKRLEIIGEYLS